MSSDTRNLRERSYDAVLFDLGGVVLDSPFPVFAEHERAHDLPEGTVTRVILGGGPDGPWARLECGTLPHADFCRELDEAARAHGLELHSARLMADMAERSRIVPEMRDAVRRIRASGRTVGALTNNWESPDVLHERMQELRDEFDVFVESWRVGLHKPDPRIYAVALERLGAPAERVIFLDDIGRNLKPARALGMATIKVESPTQALADLDRLLGER